MILTAPGSVNVNSVILLHFPPPGTSKPDLLRVTIRGFPGGGFLQLPRLHF